VELLRAAGVTHILNVSHHDNEINPASGAFASMAWVPMSDSQRLQPVVAIEAINALHSLASVPDAHVYVHCIAGMIRSPTIIWLYLIALGLKPEDARDLIEERSPVAVAGHPHMVNHEHVLLAQMHGLANFFPHPRPEIIVPFEIT
jgi:hypothetical protein